MRWLVRYRTLNGEWQWLPKTFSSRVAATVAATAKEIEAKKIGHLIVTETIAR